MSAEEILSLETQCKKNPGEPEALLRLAQTYEQNGLGGKTRLAYSKAVEFDWSPSARVDFHARLYTHTLESLGRILDEGTYKAFHTLSNFFPSISIAQVLCYGQEKFMNNFFSEGDAGDIFYMDLALQEAGKAVAKEEIPVGAVVVHKGEVIGRAHNQREELQNPVAHAEILALEAASLSLRSWRLHECTLYVTLEPCIMCVGAILQARVSRLVFGCLDPKGGAAESLYRLCDDPRLNHHPAVTRGILGKECAGILGEFFSRLREQRKNAANSEWRIANRR